jgi:hypothetical protein
MKTSQIVAERPPIVTLRPLERLTKAILDNGTCMFQVASLRLEHEKTTLMALPTSQVFIRLDECGMFKAHQMDAVLWLRKLETAGIQV